MSDAPAEMTIYERARYNATRLLKSIAEKPEAAPHTVAEALLQWYGMGVTRRDEDDTPRLDLEDDLARRLAQIARQFNQLGSAVDDLTRSIDQASSRPVLPADIDAMAERIHTVIEEHGLLGEAWLMELEDIRAILEGE